MSNATKRARAVGFVAATLLAIVCLLEPAEAAAQAAVQPPPVNFSMMGWDDNSDDLPGISGGDVLVIGAVAAAAILGIYLLTKKSSSNNDDDGAARTSQKRTAHGDQLATVPAPLPDANLLAPQLAVRLGAVRGAGSMPAPGLALGLRWQF
jgi:hypothetical protein